LVDVLQGREEEIGEEAERSEARDAASQGRTVKRRTRSCSKKTLLYGELHVKEYQDGLRAHCKKSRKT
jgi:hypothetical protein